VDIVRQSVGGRRDGQYWYVVLRNSLNETLIGAESRV
jgi:hypothetical protein